ncbi:thioredoxin domain-containing protein [Aliarcobacter lanthieri]|uniref:thioredoxin domain-containing protein n=1 Tax=Aliarcobacter lanthieri TaxID=1355374 RepID=UPI00047B64B1|nr:thioredoxin domain-containing protein [Aliarcobacter lanthieri]
MIKITKLLVLSAFASVTLLANDNSVIDFEKKRVAQNPNVKVKNIKVFYKKELELKDWNGYILELDATIQDKNMKVKDILFSDGKVIATDLYDITTGKSLKDTVTPTLSDKYYQKSKLIAGNEKAKNKIVVFSDPLCPFCTQYIPEVIDFVNKNSDQIALYYYSFPLTHIHQASVPLSKLIDIAKVKNGNDILMKVYTTDWAKYFEPNSTDETIILEAFNKELGLDIKIEELNKKEINSIIEKDIAMGEDVLVSGTPTIYVNGEKDTTREKYKSLGKK